MNTDLRAQQALDHWKENGLASLDEAERIVAAVWLFEGQVENHGFEHFISGRYGEIVAHTPVALRTVGAEEMAGLAAEAIRVFGPEGIPATPEGRREAVAELNPDQRAALADIEDRFFACEEDLDELLDRFLAASPE